MLKKELKKERKLLFFRLKYKALEFAYPETIELKTEKLVDSFLRNATVNLTSEGGLPTADKIAKAEDELKYIVKDILEEKSIDATTSPWPFCSPPND